MENKISTLKELEDIEKKYDPQLSFREIGSKLNFIIFILLISMSIYHFWASGFGLVREVLHRGIILCHRISCLVGKKYYKISFLHFQNVHYYIIFAILAVVSALYLPLSFRSFSSTRGNPEKIDVLMGSVLIILTLEATRRSVGYTLPLIAIIFILFALFGPLAPGALKHGGTSWLGFVNHIYITNQGVYGIAVGVMAQYVFLFILFGVLATRVGLGKLPLTGHVNNGNFLRPKQGNFFFSIHGNNFWFIYC